MNLFIPEKVLKFWREVGSRNKKNYQKWIDKKKINLKIYYLK